MKSTSALHPGVRLHFRDVTNEVDKAATLQLMV